MPEFTRRRLLQSVGVGTGTFAGVVGYRRFVAADSSPPDPETALAPDRDPTHRTWLPATLGRDRDARFVGHLDARALRDHRDRLPETQYRALATPVIGRDHLGIPFEAVEEVIQPRLRRMTVVVGSFDAGTVVETLLGTGHESTGEHGGFALFEGQFGQRPAVRAGAVGWTDERSDDEMLRTVIDARLGDRPWLHEESEQFAALSETIGRPAQFLAAVGEGVENFLDITLSTATAYTTEFDGENTPIVAGAVSGRRQR
jgi:hypothetical protein